MARFVVSAFLSCVVLAWSGALAPAAFLTGDPATADGWILRGNSLAEGVYMAGSANFSYDVYRSTYTLQSGDVLGWAAGDLIVGMGGVITDTPPSGWPLGSVDGPPQNADLDNNVRIVSKFGSPTATFSASTTAPIPGDGTRSFSGGAGGVGAVLLTTNAGSLTAAHAGSPQTPDNGYIWTGTPGQLGPPLSLADREKISRYEYILDDAGHLSSWQMVLNLTALQELRPGSPMPTPSSLFDQALQQGGGSSTDALVQPTPAPPTVLAGLVAVAGLAGLRRRTPRSGAATA